MKLCVENHGSVFVLQPMDGDAQDWCNDNINSEAMKWGGGIVVEHRYVEDIVIGFREAGGDVE
jgi:hypothetical protein